MANTLASKIPFSDLCDLCEKIATKPRDKRVECMKRFIAYYRDYASKLQETNPQVNSSFYPVLRLLIPQLDRERGAYGVKEHNLAKIYIRILCLPKEGLDASKLLNFRAPRSVGERAGDFADVAYWVLKTRCPGGNTLNVERVNEHLDNIAINHAAHDPRGVDAELLALFCNMSAMEQKWLIRILLKDMKLGLGHNKILAIFHPDAKELYDVTNNLPKVCQMLQDPARRLHEIEVSVFSPFRPMLTERSDARNIEKSLQEGLVYYVETKYDGERFQLHINNGEFKYFSRNGFEYTDTYGSMSDKGILTPKISRLLKPGLNSCILDGEMMGWNSKLRCYKTKGINFDVKSLKAGGTVQPCFCVFDILLYNGEVLTNRPLHERLSYLTDLFEDEEGVICHTPQVEVRTGEDVMRELNLAIDHRLEGIVLKDPASIYKPNARSGGWHKIKPEYSEGILDHLDVLIMGGYYGEGRRGGIISHFLVGLAVPSDTEGDEPQEFHSLVRVGSGYSMEELAELLLKLAPHWCHVNPGQCPPGLVWTKERPDVWIPPNKSYILQVKATEVVHSNAFKVDYTLRFPRVHDIRYDKKWSDCMTTTEFEALRKEASGKLYSRHVGVNDSGEVSPRKRKRQVPHPTITLAEQFRSAELSGLSKVSTLLSGHEFCVLSGLGNLSKQDIQTKVVEHGGSIVENPGADTFCVIAGDNNLRVRNLSQGRKYDVVHVQWLLRCVERGVLLPWVPADLLSTSLVTAERLTTQFDQFGDSYTQPASRDDLAFSLQQVDKLGNLPKLRDADIADFDIELFCGPSPFGIFRLCYAYFDTFEKVNDPVSEKFVSELEAMQWDFLFYGGKKTDQITNRTTHVVVHSMFKEDRLAELRAVNLKQQYKFYIVTEKWISESVNGGSKLNELDFGTDSQEVE